MRLTGRHHQRAELPRSAPQARTRGIALDCCRVMVRPQLDWRAEAPKVLPVVPGKELYGGATLRDIETGESTCAAMSNDCGFQPRNEMIWDSKHPRLL